MKDWADVQNLLVMRLDNIGDVLMTGPALRAIKQAMPGIHLTFMASPAGAQAAPLLPWIDDIFAWKVLWQDLGNLPFDPAREWALIDELQERKFDAAMIFTSFSQSPFSAGTACALAGIPLRLGESKERAAGILTTTATPLPDDVHQVDRNLHLIEAAGFPARERNLYVKINQLNRSSADRLLSANGLDESKPYLLLAPWASAQARTYPAERFAVAARDLSRHAGLRVVVTGSTKDVAGSGEMLNVLDGRAVNLVGMTTVGELAALVKSAKLVLTCNSSAMHLADAFRVPAIVLYSGTDCESQWRPRVAPCALLRRATPCSPCYAFTCPNHLECLDIPPDEVLEAGIKLLEGTFGKTEDERLGS